MENNTNATPETVVAPVTAAPTASVKERPERSERSEQSRDFRKKSRKKVCQFCADKNAIIDYKDAAKLRKFMSERGKILPRRVTATCSIHQRELTEAIKRARQIGLLPYTSD